jgi:hypothetical protein
MTEAQATHTLATLPWLLTEYRKARAAILHGGSRGEAHVFIGGSGGFRPDPTAQKALQLIDLAEDARELEQVNHFLDTLNVSEKKVVCARWRTHYSSLRMQKRLWGNVEEETWRRIIAKLQAYLNLNSPSSLNPCAGAVAG